MTYSNYQPSRPSSRSAPHMDGWTRAVVVSGIVALVAYVAWPHVKRELDSLGRQISTAWGMRLDPSQQDPIEDRRGERRGRPDLGSDAGLDEIGPPSWRRRGDGPETTGSPPDRTNVRRWRDCRLARNGGLDCGPWQSGSPPQGEAYFGGGRP